MSVGVTVKATRGLYFGFECYCPECYYGIHSYQESLSEKKHKYCPKCGVKLNWKRINIDGEIREYD